MRKIPRLFRIPDQVPENSVPFLIVTGDGTKAAICLMPPLQHALITLPTESERTETIEKLVAEIRTWLLEWSEQVARKRSCN